MTGRARTRCRPLPMVAAWRLMWEGLAAPTKANRWRGRVGRRPVPGSAAREPGRDRPPAGGVVDEQARPAGGPAGQHHSVAVQVELVAGRSARPSPAVRRVAGEGRRPARRSAPSGEACRARVGASVGLGRHRERRSRRSIDGRTASGWRRGVRRPPDVVAGGGRVPRAARARGSSGRAPAAGPLPNRPHVAADNESGWCSSGTPILLFAVVAGGRWRGAQDRIQ